MSLLIVDTPCVPLNRPKFTGQRRHKIYNVYIITKGYERHKY
jgi:hypothetical protein